MRIASFFLLMLCAVWGAAQEPPKSSDAPPKATATKSQEPAAAGGAPVDPHIYVIGAEDVLLIRVWREPELSGQFPVRPDGKISLPLVNELAAAGMTPEELSQSVAKRLSKYMTQPQVNVAVVQVNSKKYFIIGEIQRPGSYPLTVPTSVLEALVNAGGFRDFANPKKIIIFRKGQRLKFNYKEVIAGKRMEQNIRLESGDQIIVP